MEFLLIFKKPLIQLTIIFLQKKLNYYGIRGIPSNWFKSYLNNRKQFVSVNGFNSELKNNNCGVPQGSILGPLLFILYINDLHSSIKFCKTHHFADDTTGTCVDSSIDNLVVRAQTMVNDISNWSHRNCLTIHPRKSVMMILSPKTFIGPLPQILLDGKPITYVSKVKCLGFTIDSSLSWNDLVSSITK